MSRNVPEMRFPGFGGEWEEKKLDGLLSFKNGMNFSSASYGQGKKFINVLDVLNNNKIYYENIIGSVNDKNNKTDYLVEYGDILFLRSSETREDVGKSSVYLDEEESPLYGGFIIRGKKEAEYEPI